MIWGGGRGHFRNEFIFSREPLLYKFFSWRVPLKIYFFLERASQFFFLESESQNNFFSWRVPLEIIIFFLDKGLRFFLSRFPLPPPRSLMVVPLQITDI